MLDPLSYTVTDLNVPWWILTIFALVVIAIFLGSIYSFIRAILLFIFSDGSEQNRTKARSSIQYIIVWIIFTLLFLYLFPFVFQQLRVQWYQYYSARNILSRAWEIVRDIVNVRSIVQNGYQWSDIFKINPATPGLDVNEL